ncbi:MAG: DUF3341 domain-containing protein [Candidatus Binataceae bacterium]
MSDEIALVASFRTVDDCARAVETLHHAHINVDRFGTFSPFPNERLNEAVNEIRRLGPSRVRLWVLAGGIIGAISGFVLTIGTSWEWNLMTGGKPIASIPPFIVIAFELMILFGGMMGWTGFYFHARLPAFDSAPGYRSRFGADHFGLFLQCEEDDAARLEALLRDNGADEIVREAA